MLFSLSSSFSPLFLFLSFKTPLSFSHVFSPSLSSLPPPPFPPPPPPPTPPTSFIPSHARQSAICAVKWDSRLHNVAWGFSFQIIPQADPKFFFFFFFFFHYCFSFTPTESREKREKAAVWFQILGWKMITRPEMCLPKPKENKQMAYVFMHWTPTVPQSVCDWQTVAYNSLVVRENNRLSLQFLFSQSSSETSQTHVDAELYSSLPAGTFPPFSNWFSRSRLRGQVGDYSHPSSPRAAWSDTLW